jgi:drug/metabolite transporter (DMT)-like permease
MILNTLPVFGVAAAIAFLGERITWAQVAGAVVILIAFFLFEEDRINLRKREHRGRTALSSPGYFLD